MKKRLTRFTDTRDPNCEHKTYAVHRQGLEHNSSNTIYFECPFCWTEVKAYVWSLCGGGKRCECGALFTGGGAAHKLKPMEEAPDDPTTVL